MKIFSFLLIVFSVNVFATNIFVPTCDLRKNEEALKKLTDSQVMDKISTLLHRRDHCDAAGAIIEIYGRGVSEESKNKLFESLFDSLKRGKYLNEYTALVLGLKEEIAKADFERINEDLSFLYMNFIKNEGTNPSSQFYIGNKKLDLFDEAEVHFRFFLLRFPQNKSALKVRKALNRIYDNKIRASLDYMKFYTKNNSLKGDLLTKEILKLVKLLTKAPTSKYFDDSLNLLESVAKDSDLNSEKIQLLGSLVVDFFAKRLSASEVSQRLESLLTKINESLMLKNTSSTGLEDFLAQKGKDSTVFLPLNKDFRLTATQTLVSLGVVGILMVFDEPIMDFIQRNKEAGVLEAVAQYGNRFGEVSGLGPVILGTLGYGLVFNNNKAKNAAVSSLGAVLLGQLMIETLKSATHRSRPEADKGPFDFGGFGWGSDNTSFASGHSAAAWSVASVFAEEFGDDYKWAPAVAYGVAALTSYARMHHNKHWASDVVMGAMVGYVAGKIFHKIFRNTFKGHLENVSIVPMIGSTTGLRVIIRERAYADLKNWPLDLFYSYQKSFIEKADEAKLNEIYEDVYLQ
jgi:membrane-associated phospholipid phosphatase